MTEAQGSSELRAGTRLLMVVTQADASALGVARASMAEHYAAEIEKAIRSERARYAPAFLARAGLYALAATVLFVVLVWLTMRGTARAGTARECSARAARAPASAPRRDRFRITSDALRGRE